jgi:ACS family hexuronate transporter-like MFS transporter
LAATVPYLRWWIAAMLFGASVLNYLDRQTLSLLAPTIQCELKMDDAAYARVVNAFLIAYTFGYLISGRLTDWLGVRWALFAFVVWWSTANLLTAFALSAAGLMACRSLLGLGEAGNWTAAPKAVAEWFPASERGLAIGLYSLGATVGATIAPPVVVFLAGRYRWQSAFLVTGALGLAWLLPWLWLYREPRRHPRLAEVERALVPPTEARDAGAIPWVVVLRRPELWLLMLARMMTDPVWYFYQFWYAKYLHAERALRQDELGITWVVFLAADLGTVTGGWASGRLIRRGGDPAPSRLWVMLAAACIAPLSPLVALAPTTGGSLALAMMIVFVHLVWLINVSALVVDLTPKAAVATVFGVIAAGSTAGGIAMNSAVAQLVAKSSYRAAFVVMSLAHPLAWLLLRYGLRRRLCPDRP